VESGVYRLVIVGVHLLVVLSFELLGLGHEGSFLLHVSSHIATSKRTEMYSILALNSNINSHIRYILQQGIAVTECTSSSMKNSFERTDFDTGLNMPCLIHSLEPNSNPSKQNITRHQQLHRSKTKTGASSTT
jgi:hypothetical protein